MRLLRISILLAGLVAAKKPRKKGETVVKLPKHYRTNNKLPSLGDPVLVAEAPEGRVLQRIDGIRLHGGLGQTTPYELWTTSPCDLDHPYTAVKGHPWQELQFPAINTCVNLEDWFPMVDSGNVYRVEQFSMLPSDEDQFCSIQAFSMTDCKTLDRPFGSSPFSIGKKGKQTFEAVVDNSEMDDETRCWSFDTRSIVRSAMLKCGTT